MENTVKHNIVICGAGVVGLTVAKELLARGAEDICIIDKEARVGAHASGRNSGVLHAGIYYTPGSSRAMTCIEGNRLMREYCAEKELPIKDCGKVIVTTNRNQLPGLLELYNRATANGSQVTLIDTHELAEIEPNARTAERALHSPLTAVVDPRAILASLVEDLKASGKVTFLFETTIQGRATDNAVTTSAGRIEFNKLINACGAHADKLAHSYGLGTNLVMVPFKGCYRKLKPERAHLVSGNIYPVPDVRNPFLGVHFTKSVTGDVYIGPTATPAFGRENYGILKGLDAEAPEIMFRDAVMFFKNEKFRTIAFDELRKYFFKYFFADCAKLLNNLQPDDIINSPKAGIRPQLVDTKTNELVMDFRIEADESTVHVLNAISPAFTSSMAFAKIICDEYLAPAAG